MFTFDTLSFRQNAIDEIEQVQKQKTEFKLVGSFLRNKSLCLFAYDFENDTILPVKTEVKSKDLQLEVIYGKLSPSICGTSEYAIVLSNSIYFEALNMRNAEIRVYKWKSGRIKTLCNLRPVKSDKYLNIN